jgi:hypothetical protein
VTNDPLDISDPGLKNQIEVELAEWVRIDENAQTLYIDEWNKIDSRLAGSDVPGGFSNLYSQDYAAQRNTVANRKTSNMFVPVNRAHGMREGILGDFITGKRTLATTGRNTTDRQMAKAVNKFIQFVLDQNMFNDAVFMPAMDHCVSKGLDWLGAEYDPYGRNFKGEFKLYRANCRDILVDASANATNGSFFLTDTRRTRRWKMNTDELNWRGKRQYEKYWVDLTADSHYDVAYVPTDLTMQSIRHTTIYWVEFKHLEEAMVVGDPETGEIDVVPILEAMKIDQKYHVGPKDHEFIYRAHFNRSSGRIFHLERLPYSMFTMVPLVNIESDHRRYPLGDITVYDSLFDLVNVMATVLVKGTKSAIKGRGVGNPNIRDQTLIDRINTAIETGGFAPGLNNIIYPGAPVQLISNVLNTVQGWLQDVSNQHAATEGQIPSRQIAEETVKLLVQQDRKSHGRKDVTVRFALTQYARLISEMVTQFATDEDMVEVSDAAPGSPNYIPLNKLLTETAYKAMIADIYDIQLPQPPTDDMQVDPMQYQMQVQQAMQALEQAQKGFEKENDVKRRKGTGWNVEGEEMTDDEVARLMADSKTSPEEFAEELDVRNQPITMYAVNMINERKLDLNVRFEINTDFQADLEYRTNKAIMLRKMGMLSSLDFMKEMDEPNATEKVENAQKENQTLELAKELAANPQMMQAVQQMVAQSSAPIAR